MTEVIDKNGNPEPYIPDQHGFTRRNLLRAGAVGIAATVHERPCRPRTRDGGKG